MAIDPNQKYALKGSQIEDLASRIGDNAGDIETLEARIQALATDFSYKGSVQDYAHLPSDADTGDCYTTLDTGIIYVWDGAQWVALNRYPSVFVGTDGTSAGEDGLVPAPAITDANKFLSSDGTWADNNPIKILTEADKNWPTNSPTDIATWLLEPGSYVVTPTSAAVNINPCQSYTQIVNVPVGQSVGFTVFQAGKRYVQSADRDVVATALMVTNSYHTVATPFICYAYLGTNSYDVYEVITSKSVVNNIASTDANSEQRPISGKQSINIYTKLFPMADNEFNDLWENA